MCRVIELIVRSGLVTAWRFASWPTSLSPVLVNATTEGVVLEPSELAMTVGLCPSITATTEFVVPRSIPTTLAMKNMSRFPSRVDQPSESLHLGSLTIRSGLAAYRRSRGCEPGRRPRRRHRLSYVDRTVEFQYRLL